jgi:CRP-like cAMP-binding protein
MGPGAILGLMATFDGGPCSVSMRAVTETTLVEVTPDGLRCLFRDRGALGLELAAQLTTLAIQHLRRTTDNLTCVLYDAIAAPAQAGHVALLDMATVQSIAHAWQAAYSSR